MNLTSTSKMLSLLKNYPFHVLPYVQCTYYVGVRSSAINLKKKCVCAKRKTGVGVICYEPKVLNAIVKYIL